MSQAVVLTEDARITGGGDVLPSGAVDVNRQQLDLRTRNSWYVSLSEVHLYCMLLHVPTVPIVPIGNYLFSFDSFDSITMVLSNIGLLSSFPPVKRELFSAF